MSIWRKIKQVALTDVGVLVKGLDTDTVEAIERVLVEADFGDAAFDLVDTLEAELRRGRFKSEPDVRRWLREQLLAFFPPDGAARDLQLSDEPPSVILVLGVNGVGKTTFIARLAHRLKRSGRSVLLAAADTFRAGASEQLREWADRLSVPSVTGTERGDPAAVAYDAIEAARARGVDVVLIDTAGRLHTQGDLMEELAKIRRVAARRREGAPHESLLVLDGTVGQNALQQGRAFTSVLPVTGLVVTKLDGTARGGSVMRLRRELEIPIKFVGVGEGLDNLEPFDPERYVDRLLGD
jgi:fused signal recognition particle receptor